MSRERTEEDIKKIQEEVKGKLCHNPACKRELTVDDVHFMNIIFDHHLCNQCFAAWDSQKMRGRCGMVGLDAVDVARQLQELDGGSTFHAEADPEEKRYTESQDEWIQWQLDKGKA